MEYKDNHWHLRKEVSISTLLAILTLTIGGVYAFADISNRLTVLEVAVGKLESSPITESRLTVVEGKVENVRDQLNILREQTRAAQETQKEILKGLGRIEASLESRRND